MVIHGERPLSRREILRRFGTAAGLTIFSGPAVLAQAKINKVNVRGGAIDVHHHHQPPQFGGIGRGGP